MSQPPTPEPTPYGTSDEVSLREVFFVLLRGLPLILATALVFGVVAYVLNARQRPTYSAQSTVMVTPPAIAIEGDDTLTFRPPNEISFQSYSTLARSQEVLQDAVSRISGAEISPGQLLSLTTLRELPSTAPNVSGTLPPLSVVHTVRNANPERAAQLADAWAESTLAAVRRSLFASLELVGNQTAREAARLQSDVEAVEERVQAFAAKDEGPRLEAELDGRTRQLTDGRARLNDLKTQIAASRARIAALQEDAGAVSSSAGEATRSPELFGVLGATEALEVATKSETSPNLTLPGAALERDARRTIAASEPLSDLPQATQDALAEFALAVSRETVATVSSDLESDRRTNRTQLTASAQQVLDLALLGYAQAQTDARDNVDVLTLLRQAGLQRERVALEGLLAEAASLRGELPGYTQDVAALQQQVATLDQQRDSLNRELEKALAAYDTVTQLQASVSYLTNLAPTNARILSQASVPTAPTGPSSTFNTVIAAVSGAVLGLVIVFVWAAIRRPRLRPPHLAT